MGFFVVLEGLDQSGKKTQASVLHSKLSNRGIGTKIISFPDYSTPIGGEIKEFLSGTKMFSPMVRQILFAANRWERRESIERWLHDGKVVIADRYVGSGLAYGLANDLELEWMKSLEEGLPVPNVVILIDAPVSVVLKRKDLIDRDVYESDKEFLEKVRGAYHRLAKEYNWRVVPGNLSVESISEKIWGIVAPYVGGEI